MSECLRPLIAAAAMLAWTALALRLYLTLAIVPGPHHAIAAYLGYFTIQSNILAALVLSAWAARPGGSGWLHRPGVRAAAVVYMAVVGMVYAVLLRSLWNPQGLAKFCDVMMHDVMPILYGLLWLLAAPKGALRWRQPAWWLAFPFAYFLYSLARGIATGFYPYPFLDVTKLGYGGVLANAFVLLGVFWGLGLAMVAIDGALARARSA